MKRDPFRVAVIGVGTVGTGVVDLLRNRADLLEQRSGKRIQFAKAASRTREKMLAAGIPADMIAADYQAIVSDPEIDIVVELVGGTGVAAEIVRSALAAGKAVVTANKALLAEKGRPLFALAREKSVPLAFEAAVAGGIPIILALREGLVANRIQSILGIVNGTCNYILTEMTGKGVPYATALAEAQALGFAEADPSFDVNGIDSGHKLALLSALALESWVDFPSLPIEGISNIGAMDVEYARKLGYNIKLLAVARTDPEQRRVFLSVHPAMMPKDHPLANVQGSMNAIEIMGDVVKESMYYGRGAGQKPTASAVVADIVAVARALGRDEHFWAPAETPVYRLADMSDYLSGYYLRFMVADQPGVLGSITTCLGQHGISILSVHQHAGVAAQGPVPVIVMTHEAREGDMRAALGEIGKMEFMLGELASMRIEGDSEITVTKKWGKT